jgi:hypothetical protein
MRIRRGCNLADSKLRNPQPLLREVQAYLEALQSHRVLRDGPLAAQRESMSLKAIITTLLLGTSSLAVAAPYDQVIVRDHRTQQPVQQPAPQQQTLHPVVAQAPVFERALWMRHVVEAPKPPVTLASSQRLNGRDIIKVNDSLRAFNKIQLRAVSGRTNLDKIMITFGNGKTQTINCNRTLQANESFSVDLKGDQRNLKKIVLVGKSGRRASIDVLAL